MNEGRTPPPREPAASFRDPGGRLLSLEGRIIRLVNQSSMADLEAFLASRTAQLGFQKGRIVGTRILDPGDTGKLAAHAEVQPLLEETAADTIVEHETIPFPTFPYEWPPEMLHAAGKLTLDLAESLLAEGLGLKDATPYNVLFRGSEPVFVDILSFERRDPGDPVWLPYAQFSRTFLLPLLASKHLGWALDQLLLSRRDGLEPEEVYRACGFTRRLLPPVLTLATLPVWLSSGQKTEDPALYQKKSLGDPEKAQFILGSIFKRLQRQLRSVEPAPRKSSWSDYPATSGHYSDADAAAKRKFVAEALAQVRPGKVLDIGCNTGAFSAIAARQGSQVVAIDQDGAVIGEAWRRAQREKLAILPLVVQLGRPSPAVGWRNQECPSFLDRARGAFDAVLMLAVLHHLLVNERVPLEDVLDLAGELTTRALVIEYVDPTDPMFRRIVRGREHLFRDLTREGFESACRGRFRIVRSQHLNNTRRWLYLLEKPS